MCLHLIIDMPPTPPLSPLPHPLLMPVQPEYVADIAPPSSINPSSVLSPPPNSAACASSTMALAPTLVIPPSAMTPAASTAASLCMIQVVMDPTAAPKPTHPALHCPHPILNSLSLLTSAIAFSQMPQVEDYAITDNLPQWPVAQKAKAPIQGSNTLGSAVTALSAVPMSPMLAVLLVGMGPLLPHPSCVPLRAATTMAMAA